jgi:regulatory protein
MPYGRSQPRPGDKRSVTSYAVWLLARRSYTANELLKKFRTRFRPAEPLFVEVLDQLKKLGLQSDQGFAENFTALHPGWGQHRIRLELAKKGVSKELITETLANDDTESARAREALAGRLRGKPAPTDFRERQKLLAFLGRRGFSLDVIKQII